MSKFKNMKFNISNNPEVSKAIQGILFSIGYRWYCDEKQIQSTDEPFLFADASGKITYDNNKQRFLTKENEEINIEWMKPSSVRETVELNNNLYYKDELEEALANIRPIDNE